MANELWINNRTAGLTIYCVIRRKSDMKVLVESTLLFEVWNNANIATYDFVLADRSGDLYSADHPAITTGITYLYSYYIRLGASPAITDTLLDSVEGAWTGIAIDPSGGSVVLSGYALTTLDEVKRELNITATTDDDYLKQLINQESASIEKELDRNIKARDYNSLVRTKWGQVRIKHTPLLAVNRVAFGEQVCLNVKYNTSCLRATIQISTTEVKGIVIATNGTTTTNTITLSSTTTASELATLIGNWSVNWIVTSYNDCLSTELYTSKALPLNNDTGVNLLYPNTDDNQAFILDENGIVGLTESANYEYVIINYRAGYETIPDDINQYCISRVVNDYVMRAQGLGLKSASLEGYSYTLGNVQESIFAQKKELTNKYKHWGIA